MQKRQIISPLYQSSQKHYNLNNYQILMLMTPSLSDPYSSPSQLLSWKYKRIKDYIYNMQQILGKGSFSIVYKAIQQTTNQHLAIKVVKLATLTFKKLQELLDQEINIISSLNHPNIIRCLEVLKSSNHCYFVTELCEGGNLQKTLRERGPMQQEEIWWMVRQIYQGLKYLSSKNIIHRDIKPANIFIKNTNIKIADFGFAIQSNQPFSDFSIGSPLYMSPQGYLTNQYGPKTDVWAFGVVLYELIHGKQPLASCVSDDDLKSNICKNIRDDQFKEQLSYQLKDFIKRCLEVDVAKRITFQQMEKTPYFQRYLNVRSMSEIRINHSQRRISVPYIQQQTNPQISMKSIQFTPRNTQFRPITNDKQNTRSKQNFILPTKTLKTIIKKQIIDLKEIESNKNLFIEKTPQLPLYSDILQGNLTFNQSIGLIHYCRIGYKLCQEHIEQELAISVKSLILKILLEIQNRANLGTIKYEQQENRIKKQSKLKLILQQYKVKYQKELRGDIIQVNLQQFSRKLEKEYYSIQEKVNQVLYRCYLTMIFHEFTSKLVKCIASKSYTVFGEIGFIDTCLDDKLLPKETKDYKLAKLKYSSPPK